MLNILINAYAVSPIWGSEPGMGWHWIVNLAKYCNVYVITEGEWRREIEDVLPSLPQRGNIHFFYNTTSDRVRKMCWNQGDWRFYFHYRRWQKKTLRTAEKIVEEYHIDIIHQLNMIGFREPGMLWKIRGIPFVWGPVGGMELMSTGFLEGESLMLKVAVYLKNLINDFQRRHNRRVKRALIRADSLSAAAKGVYDFIQSHYKKELLLLNETGCYESDVPAKSYDSGSFDILWVGKFDYRKQLGLALETVALLRDLPGLKLHVVGYGSRADQERFHSLSERLGISAMVVWHGKIPNVEVHDMMRRCSILFFTSIMEGTPHVVLEAIQNRLPVLCFDAHGEGGAVNGDVGVKIPLTNKRDAVNGFASAIREMYASPEMMCSMSRNCEKRGEELSWDKKALLMMELYYKAVENFSRKL